MTNTIRLRHHHIRSLYEYRYKHSEQSYKNFLRVMKYTNSESDYLSKRSRELLNKSEDTQIEITDLEDFICEGCPRKEDSERVFEFCNTPEPILTLEDPTYGVQVMLNFKVGKAYTLKRMLEKLEKYHSIEQDVFKAGEINMGCGMYHLETRAENIQKKLLKKGLLTQEDLD